MLTTKHKSKIKEYREKFDMHVELYFANEAKYNLTKENIYRAMKFKHQYAAKMYDNKINDILNSYGDLPASDLY